MILKWNGMPVELTGYRCVGWGCDLGEGISLRVTEYESGWCGGLGGLSSKGTDIRVFEQETPQDALDAVYKRAVRATSYLNEALTYRSRAPVSGPLLYNRPPVSGTGAGS